MLITKFKFSLSFLLLALTLSACGFSPTYKGGQDGVAKELAQIAVATISNREGQILRNHLLVRLTPRQAPSNPAYRLNTNLSVASSGYGTAIDENTSRGQITITADFRLSALQEGADEIHNFKIMTKIGYSISNDIYATETAKNTAIEQGLELIADDARHALSLYLRHKDK